MRRQNLLLSLLALLILILPLVLPASLMLAPVLGAEGQEPETFAGADGKAQAAIVAMVPAYEPWFDPLFKPPGGEVESLLFALQAAFGAGFLGFWLGGAVMRERLLWQRPASERERE
ncbi:MAG: energy-coupling factor ABC transporter substrate-binding protein [Azovibrio sp.]|uniref:energy-coupling factor ABC transporter substrate-binding protein n=1 Tax=Azovibrio sp. TaxID=1872673 RepID=UPI003C77B95B